ncbi:hypothetical protein ACQEVC_45410 [Plantactinospora sp. CA-294935]|uniref:hypothetical protein n=1 Tax=Plantactinospora sp. CA-294935 TaxID=3240012 RepID=UPI003D8B79E6
MKPSDDLMAWLGPAADELTPEQIERVTAEARAIAERYPDPDEQPERDAALSAVVQYLLGETTPEDAAHELSSARLREQRAFAAATWMAVMLVRDNPVRYKAVAAQRAGIDRMSLLKALGER